MIPWIPYFSYAITSNLVSGEFLFTKIWNTKHWYDEGGDSACPPIPPLRSRAMMMNYLFVEFSNCVGSQSGGVGNPRECLACTWAFPMKIVLSRNDTGIVTTLSLRYDDCRRPRRVTPTADRWLKCKKTSCPPCLGEALRRGSFIYSAIFMV